MARVLIVDDNVVLTELISITVSTYGHDPLIAHDGYEALELIATKSPDVVLLDLMMPGIDGFETLEHIRSMPHGRELPVIVITARQDEDLEERVASVGGVELLRKPVRMQALADAIAVQVTP